MNLALLQNLINNVSFLRNDFIGIFIPWEWFFVFTKSFIVASLTLITFLFFGEKLLPTFNRKIDKTENAFIALALGYIVTGTIIAILGIFSLLNTNILILFLIIIFFVAFYPFYDSLKRFKVYALLITQPLVEQKTGIGIFLLLFILIGFLRLIPPESGVDAIWYLTGYPRLYLENHSLMIQPDRELYLITVPQLGSMWYVITDFFGAREASRIIHFFFYVLVIVLIISSYRQNRLVALYAAILFVTSPVVIRHTSSAYVNFQLIFCWLLVLSLIVRDRVRDYKNIFLSAILFGGTLATKLWALVFLPVFLLFLFICFQKETLKQRWKALSLFFLTALSVPFIWYLRSFLLTANPFFPQFAKEPIGTGFIGISNYLEVSNVLFRIKTVFNFSPLTLFVVFLLLYKVNLKNSMLLKSLFSFVALVVGLYFILPSPFYLGMYALVGYVTLVPIFAFIISTILRKNMLLRSTFLFSLLLLFVYYSVQTLVLVPYGLGWADKNKYLSRILSRDNSSYYDYEHKFSPFLKEKDLVATYRLRGFYYADFNHKDISFFVSKDYNLDRLSQKGVTKILVKGGPLDWVCKKEEIKKCDSHAFVLLAEYPLASQYLYAIQ